MKEVVRPSRRRSIRDLDRFCSSALLKADWVLRAWTTRLWVLSAHWRWPSSVVCYLGTYPLSPELLSAWAILIQSTDAYAQGVRRPEPPSAASALWIPRCDASLAPAPRKHARRIHESQADARGWPSSVALAKRPPVYGGPAAGSGLLPRAPAIGDAQPASGGAPLTHGSTPGPCPTLRG